MGTHTIHRTSVPTTHTGTDYGRLLFTIIGGSAMVVAAFLNWTRDMTGVTLSNRSLIKTEFLTQPDVVRTVGGIAVVLGLAGIFGLVERSAWLTRLCGLLGLALFVMFTIEVYRSSVHTMQPGVWLALGGSIVLMISGFLPAAEVVTEATVVEEREVDPFTPAAPRNRGADIGSSTETLTRPGTDTGTDTGADIAAESERHNEHA